MKIDLRICTPTKRDRYLIQLGTDPWDLNGRLESALSPKAKREHLVEPIIVFLKSRTQKSHELGALLVLVYQPLC